MRKSTRRSMMVLEDTRNSVGSLGTQVGTFSTRFSLPSFVKRVEKLTNDQRNAIKKVGFGNLLLLPNQMLSKNLLAELMERWNCENRAFVLPPGELEISLLDVALILGLPVVGNPVMLKDDEPLSSLEEEFGATSSKRKISISTVESKLDSLEGAANDEFVRSFLMLTFGILLFPNASGKVDSRYLSCLEHLDEISSFAWGTAVLEDIISWLNKRKESNIQYVGGCLIFLQVWSYEHIHVARPGLLDSYLTFPRACRWENGKSHQKQWFSTRFKELEYDQITWRLEPTSVEKQISIIKEFIGARNETEGLSEAENELTETELEEEQLPEAEMKDVVVSDTEDEDEELSEANNEDKDLSAREISCSPVFDGVGVQGCSDNDIRSEVEEDHKLILEQQNSSTSCCKSPIHLKLEKLSLTPEEARKNSPNGNEDGKDHSELRKENNKLRDEILVLKDQLEQKSELRKETDKLRDENLVLKEQLSSHTMLEEQVKKLQKELEDLQLDYKDLKLLTVGLVSRTEDILSDEEANAPRES